ncbi:MAG: hypothetical protein Sapg2KO_37290 [Saprospiraceae bacterium]
MKKIVVSLSFLCFTLLGLQAQEGDIRFGIQTSPTFTWMNTADVNVNRSGTNLGLKLAMMSEYYFRENYAVTSGIGFHFNSGGQMLFEDPGTYWPNSDLSPGLDSLASGAKLRYNLQYVEIPLGLKMKTREFGYLSYWLEPSLSMGFRSQARGTMEGRRFDGATIGEEGEKINIRDEVTGINLAWGLGGGVEYTLSGTTSLLLGINMQFGFTDITKNTGTYFDDSRGGEARQEDSRAKITVLSIKAGILF